MSLLASTLDLNFFCVLTAAPPRRPFIPTAASLLLSYFSSRADHHTPRAAVRAAVRYYEISVRHSVPPLEWPAGSISVAPSGGGGTFRSFSHLDFFARSANKNLWAMMAAALEQFLFQRPEDALELRRAPPSHGWLVACQRCQSAAILFAFFEGLSRTGPTPKSAHLAALLRKFRTHGSQRITLGNRVLLIVDDDDPTPPGEPDRAEAAFIYLDRRRHVGPVMIPHQIARHVICEHGQDIVDNGATSGYEHVVESVWLPAAVSVGPHAFEMRSTLAHVSLPVIQSIGKWAFRECICLRSVSLPATDVEVGAFIGCARLQNVALPLVQVIAANLFWECRSLCRVSMPAATRVQYDAFRKCVSLECVDLPAACSIEESAFFNCTKLRTVSLPSAKFIGDNAFGGCPNLKLRATPEVSLEEPFS